jgi:putative FmdB family regulatory protein
MPFYEYECRSCGHHLEAMQKMHAAPLRKCPACGRSTLKRLMSAAAFRLKGGGWYETDFKSDKEGQRNIQGEKSEAPAEPAASTEKTAPAAADASAAPAAAAPPAKPATEQPAAGKAAAEKPAEKPAGKPASASSARRRTSRAARAKPRRP